MKSIEFFIKHRKKTIFIFLFIAIVSTSLILTYGAFKDFESVTPGINGANVIIDDQAADYYYYIGQNYTNSTNGQLPTLTNKNIYGDSNLVPIEITYDGRDINNNDLVGYVSLTERQNKFIYHKYAPVSNGYVDIELIDNPFNDHPIDKVFNGWVTDYENATISLDTVYYTRSVRIPVSFSNGKPDKINITLHASWINGAITNVGGTTTFNTAFGNLTSDGMNEVEIASLSYDNVDVSKYYLSETITTVSTVTGNTWRPNINTNYATCTNCYDTNKNYYTGSATYTCPAPELGTRPNRGTYENECTIYKPVPTGSKYDDRYTYYAKDDANRFTEVGIEELKPEIQYKDDFSETHNMAGYFKKVTKNNGNSITGFYNANGELLSGNCSSTSCVVYDLIQYDDEEYPSMTDTYYYLTTRDTNVIVMTSNLTGTWSATNNKPFTLTSVNDGRDYNARWTVSNTTVNCYNDTRIEEITIVTNSNASNNGTPSNSNNTTKVFLGNFQNAKLGRNIKSSGSYVNFVSIIGGKYSNTQIGTANSPEKYRLQVESGYYSNGSLVFGGATGTNGTIVYTEMQGIFGNDYDRATKNNNKLRYVFCTAGSWSGRIHSSNDTTIPSFTTIVKSGSFGTGEYDLSTGIYVGGRYGGTHYAPRAAKIEGGFIYNLIGGPVTSNKTTNDTLIYMTGGEVNLLTGGAGTSTTYGNRILQITGGTVNYSVFGGSNGVTGTSQDGTLTGDSYLYIGGNAVIGNDDYIAQNRTQSSAESGSVFGAGNGNDDYVTIGSVNNSNIIIADDAVVKRNVYGSGNFGTVGYSSSSNNVDTNIELIGGTVNGSVFGSGNQSGSGRSTKNTNVNINLNGANIQGGIYGGSNLNGTVYGSTNIVLSSGKTKDVFGGGYGANTYVSQNVSVRAGSSTSQTSAEVEGAIYGGSSFGTVNSTSKTTNVSSYTTKVQVNKGNIANVFGGGKGDSNNNPYVCGNVTVDILGGTVTNVYGGNDASFEPNGSVTVNIRDANVTNAFGGGNATRVSTTNINQYSGTVENLFGGSNSSGDVVTSNVSVSGGTTTNVYGGNNLGGTTATSNVRIYYGNIDNVYGGGYKASTSTSNVDISNGEIKNVYGGGNQAPVTTSNVNLNYANITNAFGGGYSANVTTTKINLQGATVERIYGGGNQAGADTTNLKLISGKASEAYGGSNLSGQVNNANVTTDNPNNLTVETIFGGNNQAGLTRNSHVNLKGGNYVNVYGGGNVASTNYVELKTDNIAVTNEFFGGGKEAPVNYNIDVDFINSNSEKNVFGGGNLGIVHGDTNLYFSDSHAGKSVFAGGNGNSAVVEGNTTLSIDGASTIGGDVFGGGNAANTGIEANADGNNPDVNIGVLSTVKVAGATVEGNVFGAANTAQLFGRVDLKIGADSQSTLKKSDILIKGTVYGGSNANQAGDDKYDFNYIGVTAGINMTIDGAGYDNFSIKGSIFGGGNFSRTVGYSYVNIYNYGTFNNYKDNVSIQRVGTLVIKNSAIRLEGAADRDNYFKTTEYSISRVQHLKLANNSTLFLDEGANLLEKFSSLKITDTSETYATVDIDENGVSRSVNNRLYMQEGKNITISSNQSNTAYEEVNGMTFFGMYQVDRNGKVYTGLYNKSYDDSSTATGSDIYAFTLGSYVEGLHKTDHDITVDGFYTNFADEEREDGIITDYITPTPPVGPNYMWSIGEEVLSFDITLTASKYATLGAEELALSTFNAANTKFEVLGFNYQGLDPNLELVDKNSIPRISTDGQADKKMGLSMEPANTGFLTVGPTSFTTDPSNPILGDRLYKKENTENVPSFVFYLYHSKNISLTKDYGTVTVSLMAAIPVDALNYELTRININISINSALYNDNVYEGALTSGARYGMFKTLPPTNVTNKSTISAYYSLYMETDKPYYKDGYYHALVSSFVLPEKTKITMIDLASGNKPKYYYKVISSDDVTRKQTEFATHHEASYKLEEFVTMGAVSSANEYDEIQSMNSYYDANTGIIEEEFIFIVDFEDTEMNTDELENSLLLELRNQDSQTLLNVLGIQQPEMTYSLYNDKNAVIDLNATLSSNKIYLGDTVDLDVSTDFIQPSIGALPIIDTTFNDKKLGIIMSIYDNEGKRLNNSSVLGLTYELDGITYHPRMDGTVRISISDKVANVLSRIKLHTANLNLNTGNYTLKIESFGSADGIYYGITTSDSVDLPFSLINSRFGLAVDLPDEQVIVNKDTGMTLIDNNLLLFDIEYESNLSDPNIRLSLERRTYDEVYSLNYERVDLADYITNNLVDQGKNIYKLIDNPVSKMQSFIYLKNNLRSGTYKFVFSLYDGNVHIGDCEKYVIIK